jgi:hypothetical protein
LEGSFCYIPPFLTSDDPADPFHNCQKSGTANLCSQRDLQPSEMSTVPEWRSAEGLRFPQYTRPFLSWDEVQKLCPCHLEVQRFLRLREGIRASAWYQRRSHAPCDLEVPPGWGLDSLYFRHACEKEYGRHLSELRENP